MYPVTVPLASPCVYTIFRFHQKKIMSACCPYDSGDRDRNQLNRYFNNGGGDGKCCKDPSYECLPVLYSPLLPPGPVGPLLNNAFVVPQFVLLWKCAGRRRAATLVLPASAGEPALIKLLGGPGDGDRRRRCADRGGFAGPGGPYPLACPGGCCPGASASAAAAYRTPCPCPPLCASPYLAQRNTRVQILTDAVGVGKAIMRGVPTLMNVPVPNTVGPEFLRLGCSEDGDGVLTYSAIGAPDTCLAAGPTDEWLCFVGVNKLQRDVRVGYSQRVFSPNGRELMAVPTSDCTVFSLAWRSAEPDPEDVLGDGFWGAIHLEIMFTFANVSCDWSQPPQSVGVGVGVDSATSPFVSSGPNLCRAVV